MGFSFEALIVLQQALALPDPGPVKQSAAGPERPFWGLEQASRPCVAVWSRPPHVSGCALPGRKQGPAARAVKTY